MEVHKTAFLSPNGVYRYILTRMWDVNLEKLYYVMLNPSTADASDDDPTIRRCIHFAMMHGYGGIVVVNLFAYRATNPQEVRQFYDIAVGPENQRVLEKVLKDQDVCCAWGSYGTLGGRAQEAWPTIRGAAARVFALGVTAGHQPRHPLYLKNTSALEPYEYPITR